MWLEGVRVLGVDVVGIALMVSVVVCHGVLFLLLLLMVWVAVVVEVVWRQGVRRGRGRGGGGGRGEGGHGVIVVEGLAVVSQASE